jgi:hypothetical protein
MDWLRDARSADRNSAANRPSLILERSAPRFRWPPGKYLVAGDLKVTTVLTIHPKDKDGNQGWELADGATLYDVTHLGCLSARHTPALQDFGPAR